MPTIEDIQARPYRLPLRAPLRWGKRSELRELSHLLLTVELSDGSFGQAEVAIRPTIYGETPAGALAALEYLRPQLVGLDAEDTQPVREVLEGLPYNFALKGALDIALWEAWARAQGQSLPEVFRPARHRVRVAYILGIGEVEEVLEDARFAYAQGVRVFKVKVGRDLAMDLRRIQALKEAFPDVGLYADANETLSPKEASAYLRAWREAGLSYVEEPLPIEEVPARTRLKAEGVLPIIADDSAFTLRDLKRELYLDTFDVLNLKPARTGFTWTLEMLSLAREKGKKAMVGSQAQSGLGAYHSALMAFQRGVTEPCELAFHLKVLEDPFHFPPFREGWLYWEDLLEAGWAEPREA
ncbi:MAG: enolase C-terminal domain-like protein [Thermaceae bacterium]